MSEACKVEVDDRGTPHHWLVRSAIARGPARRACDYTESLDRRRVRRRKSRGLYLMCDRCRHLWVEAAQQAQEAQGSLDYE